MKSRRAPDGRAAACLFWEPREGYHEVNSFRLAFGKPPSRRRKGNAASVRKRRAQCAVSKLANGKKTTSSRQGVLVCGALRLPHDLMRLPLLFPQNSLRDFCGNPERQESICSPLSEGGKGVDVCSNNDSLGLGVGLTTPPSRCLGKPSDSETPPLTQGRLS